MRRVITIATISVGLALVCASFLGFAATVFWFFDLLNHFRVQYLIVGIGGILIALLLRSKWSLVAFSAVAVVNALLLLPLYLPQPEGPPSLRELSIVSYNTWRHNDDWTSVLPVLQGDAPDIAYFTETHPSIRSGLWELESEYQIFEADADVLLIRRNAELSPKLLGAMTPDRVGGLPVTLTIEGVEVALFAVHPAAPRSSSTAESRDQSFAAIASFLENYKGLVIVVGDLNATPWSRPFRDLQKQTGLANSQVVFGIQSTWPSYPNSCFDWLIRIPIDHCLHRPAIYTIDRRVGQSRRSNHNPIFIRLGIHSGTAAEYGVESNR